MLKGQKINTMNSKVTTNSQPSTTESKTNKNKNKLSNQQEREQNHKNGDHMEGYRWGGGRRRMREKVQELRSTICRYKIDRGVLRIV